MQVKEKLQAILKEASFCSSQGFYGEARRCFEERVKLVQFLETLRNRAAVLVDIRNRIVELDKKFSQSQRKMTLAL